MSSLDINWRKKIKFGFFHEHNVYLLIINILEIGISKGLVLITLLFYLDFLRLVVKIL